MKKHWRTIFFVFGVAAVVLMLLTFDADWNRVREVLSEAGIWFPEKIRQCPEPGPACLRHTVCQEQENV